MGAGIVAGLCCCSKGNPPIPDENQYYECEPMVCEQGFNNCFAPPVSLWYVVFTPEDIELMVGEFEIDPETFKWVWAGQMWQCVRFLGSESEKPLAPYSETRTFNVGAAFNTISEDFPPPTAVVLTMPDHRITANNTGEVAQPTAEDSLTLQRSDDGSAYITKFHMVNSFVHEMHNQFIIQRYLGEASIGNAVPNIVNATLGNPDRAFSLVQYAVTPGEIGGQVLTVSSTSDFPYPVGNKPFEKTAILSAPSSVALRYDLDLESLELPRYPLPIGGYAPDQDYFLISSSTNFNVVFVSGERVRGVPHTDGVRNFMEGDNNECERFGPATYIPEEAFSQQGGNAPFWPDPQLPLQSTGTVESLLTSRRTVRQLEVDSCKLLSSATLKTEGQSAACPTGSFVVFSLSDAGFSPKPGRSYVPPRTIGQLSLPAEIGDRGVSWTLFSVG